VYKLELTQQFQWSVVDRWATQPGFISEIARIIRTGLESLPENDRDSVLLLFSAHSIPLSLVNQGDPYKKEIEGSVGAVMQQLHYSNEYLLSYQSAVGPVKWLGPSTYSVLCLMVKEKNRMFWLFRFHLPATILRPYTRSISNIRNWL
jgi:ferrochelatase